MAQWEAGAILHLMETEKYDMVFSHFHNVDGMGHMIMKFLKDRGKNKLSEEPVSYTHLDVYKRQGAPSHSLGIRTPPKSAMVGARSVSLI